MKRQKGQKEYGDQEAGESPEGGSGAGKLAEKPKRRKKTGKGRLESRKLFNFQKAGKKAGELKVQGMWGQGLPERLA